MAQETQKAMKFIKQKFRKNYIINPKKKNYNFVSFKSSNKI